jgi:hypothetical protein
LFEIFLQCEKPSLRRTLYLTITELRNALHACIKITQQEIYAQKVSELSKNGQVWLKSHLLTLHPFLDKEVYLGVGGRLQHSHFSYDTKH